MACHPPRNRSYGGPGEHPITDSQMGGAQTALVACLFDIDGTLADTGAAIREAIVQVLREEGIRPTWEEIRSGWTLAGLEARGIALGVVTSKRRTAALCTLRTLGLERHFPVVVCEEDAPVSKPDPAPRLLAAERQGVPPALSVMVGDGGVDVSAGKAAGMRTSGALWGTVAPELLRAAGPDWLPQTPSELLSIFPGRE